MRLLTAIRQLICRHEFQPTKFQALVPVTSFECTKCGRMAYRDR
jgi:hypothetical protein